MLATATTYEVLPGQAHPATDAATLARDDHPVPWTSGPDPSELEALDRLLDRLPPRFALLLDLRARGLTTSELGRVLGTSQPTAWARLQVALSAARWASATLPDYAPAEVRERVLVATRSPRDAAIVASYWASWRTSEIRDEAGRLVPQSTAWTRLVYLTAALAEVEPDLARGLRALQRPEVACWRLRWRLPPVDVPSC